MPEKAQAKFPDYGPAFTNGSQTSTGDYEFCSSPPRSVLKRQKKEKNTVEKHNVYHGHN